MRISKRRIKKRGQEEQKARQKRGREKGTKNGTPKVCRYVEKKAKFQIVYSSYLDSLGFFASLVMKIIGYDEKKGIGSPKSLKFYDKYIIPISFFLDRIGLKFFFGKNLVLLAKK